MDNNKQYQNKRKMKCKVIRVNGQPSIIYQSSRKLMWLSLPELSSLAKFYTRSNFIQAMGAGSLFVLDKNCVSFITVNLAPLSLNVFKQDFLDWQPTGGVCLSLILILYNKHTINFYERTQNLKKTWTIEVMQQITQIKSSPEQKVIGMTVKEKNNTVFLWNLHDISNKPFQQITISQKIIKWQFYSKDMLIILTSTQIQVYYPKEGQYCLQFFLQMAHLAIDFCFLERPKSSQHSGRRAVYPISVLSPGGKVFIYELYDVDKRIKNSLASISATIELQQNITSIICGFQNENNDIIICTQTNKGKPFSLILTSQYIPKQKFEYLPQLPTQNPSTIQYCKQIICTQNSYSHQKFGQMKQYKLYKMLKKQDFQLINQINCKGIGLLGGYNFFNFDKEQGELVVYRKNNGFKDQQKVKIQGVKVGDLILLQEKDQIVYFVSGIRIFRLNIAQKVLKPFGFVIKNQKFKLIQVRNQTRSLLYKSNDQYLLLQYQTPQNPEKQSEKVIIKTIKSSPFNMISLRNNRWVQKYPQKLIFGQGIKILIQFDLVKFFKSLTQQNNLIQYQIYWTTHDGIILLIKNYLFVLELVQSSDGYSVNLIKKSLNYLHCRFDPDANGIQLMDARNIVVREGSRVLQFKNKLGNFSAEDPFSLPDTLLRRQLMMRKIYPPHHPKIVQYLIQLGYFSLLQTMFNNLLQWLHKNGTISELYNRIGISLITKFVNKQIQKININSTDLDAEKPMKKLCELILENPHLLQLQQKGSLILQSQIQALIFRQQNSRSLDTFSQTIITQFKTFQAKNENFKTMHIAYMLHSINKQEAIGILRQQVKQIDWEWVKKYSIIMWFDNKNQIKNWAQQIGTNLFKISKEPLDCLFWYTIAGKKTVLVQLFKKYIYNTAEHEKIFKFLQRDFSQQKNQNAAVNNAYALVDKKRYIHALAFFIYGQKIDQAISLCLNKLKDINLAFLICNIMQDNITKQKLIQTLFKQGDVWAKHIVYFYKNQHIDSFNCLFEQQDIVAMSHWNYQPKLTNFHPCLKQFAQLIQKSIPVKRQLQQQKIKKTAVADPNDIFQSFFGNQTQAKVQQQQVQQKQLSPNYQWIIKQSVSFFIRNSCPSLALMLQPTNAKAKRAYDLYQFLITKQVNSTVIQLIQDMQDYVSITDQKIKQNVNVKDILQNFNNTFKQVLQKFQFSNIISIDKAKIGQLMHYGYIGQVILNKLKQNHIQDQSNIIKTLDSYIQISKILLVLELQIFQSFQNFTNQLISHIIEPQKSNHADLSIQFWQSVKSHYDKIAQPKKNKKQNLYDEFQQSLYKYVYKKAQLVPQNTNFKLNIEQCTPIFIKKMVMTLINAIFTQKGDNGNVVQILDKIKKKINLTLRRWAESKMLDQLYKQYNTMITDGVVSKLKLNFTPGYLQQNFQTFCRGTILLKFKLKKPPLPQKFSMSKSPSQNLLPSQVIQIFRNKQQSPKFFSVNKNQGLGMQLAMVTKRGVKKLQICDSLLNRNRSQDGISLIHDDIYYNMESKYELKYKEMLEYGHLPLIDRFLYTVLQNRKQYDGLGIIKGSAKRTSPDYLKTIDPLPYVQPSQINCIQCHHFLPIYLLGTKSSIQLCQFATNNNYNRIKCPNMSDIVKIKSYQQRVTALDNAGNLGSYSFDAKISGNSVFSLKKMSIIDYCLMTPSTYGICTNNSIQVIDSLLHPKRQVVFKTVTNQSPIAIDYFQGTKLTICRRSDMLIFDTRMDVLQQSRDLGGKAKCMTSNFKNRLLVGRMDNKVRVLDVSGQGSQSDYDVKCVSGFRGDNSASIQKCSVEDIQIMGKLAVALNSDGVMSMFSIQ